MPPVNLSPTSMLLAIALLVLGWVMVKKLYAVDDRVEKRHDMVNQLNNKLIAWGFTDLPKVLNKYVISDYDGIFAEIKHLLDIYSDPVQAAQHLKKLFDNMLVSLAKNEETRPALLIQLKKLIAQYETATTSTTTTPSVVTTIDSSPTPPPAPAKAA